MSDDVLVKVDNVSKRFCRSLNRSLWYGLQDLGSEIGDHRHGWGSGLPQSSADVQLRPDECLDGRPQQQRWPFCGLPNLVELPKSIEWRSN